MKLYIKGGQFNQSSDNTRYGIAYGRGELAEFYSLQDAKDWQVANIFDYDSEAGTYDWVEEDIDDEHLLRFQMYDYDGDEIEADITDGAGWYIEMLDAD